MYQGKRFRRAMNAPERRAENEKGSGKTERGPKRGMEGLEQILRRRYPEADGAALLPSSMNMRMAAMRDEEERGKGQPGNEKSAENSREAMDNFLLMV